MSNSKIPKILSLSANPSVTNQSLLYKEVQGIKEELERTKYCDRFEFVNTEIMCADDLHNALSKHKPDIIYFSGDGTGEQGIVIKDDRSIQMSTKAVSKLFEYAAQTAKCVFLNGCYYAVQAKMIHQHIDCVIGTNQAISDRAAIRFAAKFYQELVDGASFQSAYDSACLALDILDCKESATPELLNRTEENAPPAINISEAEISGQVGLAGGNLTQIINNIFGLKTSSQFKLPTVLLISSSVAVLVTIARFLGYLQPLELWFYDRLLKTQAELSKVDDKILVVGITKEDYEDQKKQEKAGKGKLVGSISNEKLTELLRKLDKLKPIAIGLDLYREEPVDGKQYSELLNRFKNRRNLFALCKVTDPSDPNSSEAAPPDGFPPERVGFSDFAPLDRNGQVLRRHLLAFKPSEESPCKADISFNLRLANFFLSQQQESIKYDSKQLFTPEGYCQDLQFTNSVVFPNFQPYTGGYQGYSSNDDSSKKGYWGCQVLLKYQNGKIDKNAFHGFAARSVAENVSLKEILDEKFPVSEYKDRIILIGVVRSDGGNDYWSTPVASEQTPGVIIQAQMISQIIKAVSKESALIWVFPQWGEAICILVASLVGGTLGYLIPSNRYLIIGIGGVAILWLTGCFLIFYFISGWLPFIPTVLVLVVSGTIVGMPRLLKLDPSLKLPTPT